MPVIRTTYTLSGENYLHTIKNAMSQMYHLSIKLLVEIQQEYLNIQIYEVYRVNNILWQRFF